MISKLLTHWILPIAKVQENASNKLTSVLLSNNKCSQWMDKSIDQVFIEDPLRV